MLNSIDLNNKTYEELLKEAVEQIPLYSEEWTNFNVSDPGITVLENLTAFNLLQQRRVNEVTDDIRRAMLKLLGHTPRENKSATVLVQTPEEPPRTLPAQYQLKAGSLTFETEQITHLTPWTLKAVYAVDPEGGYRDVTYLMDAKVGSAPVFGAQPEPGASLCLVLDGLPAEGETLRMWMQVAGESERNPFNGEEGPVFAHTRWQYYTAQGWQDAAAVDETRAFLVSGPVTLTLDKGAPAPFGEAPQEGYALRCLLEETRYDRAPRLATLAVNLFPMEQKETLAKCYLFQGGARVEVKSQLAAQGFLFVYCREKSGQPYRLYQRYAGVGEKGRYYLLEEREDGVVITFDKARFGFAPGRGWGAVRVVCYNGEMVHHRDLGVVYGYEDQEIPLDLVHDLLPDQFSLIAETPGEDGEMEYRFVAPGNTDPDRLCYRVQSRQGTVRIVHPGVGVEYRLYLCDCAVTRGAVGNIRAGNRLIHISGPVGMEQQTVFHSPAPGRGGQSWEDPEELRLRFAASMREVTTAVLPSDYEHLVRNTPGLCIHKVKAQAFPEENLVKVVIKPYTEERYPKLSPEYLRQIRAHVEARRLLTTRVELVQPRYIPINVTAVLYIRQHYRQAEGEVRQLLELLLDHVHGDAGFGGWVRFSQIYRQLADLPCVAAVDTLYLSPATTEGAALVGTDVRLGEDSLCCPGTFRLDFHNDVDGRHR